MTGGQLLPTCLVLMPLPHPLQSPRGRRCCCGAWGSWSGASTPSTGSTCVQACSSWSASLAAWWSTRSSTCCSSCSVSSSSRCGGTGHREVEVGHRGARSRGVGPHSRLHCARWPAGLLQPVAEAAQGVLVAGGGLHHAGAGGRLHLPVPGLPGLLAQPDGPHRWAVSLGWGWGRRDAAMGVMQPC